MNWKTNKHKYRSGADKISIGSDAVQIVENYLANNCVSNGKKTKRKTERNEYFCFVEWKIETERNEYVCFVLLGCYKNKNNRNQIMSVFWSIGLNKNKQKQTWMN